MKSAVIKVSELGNEMLGEEMDTISHDGEVVMETGNRKETKMEHQKKRLNEQIT